MWKVLPLGSPGRKAFPTKLPTKEILMRINNDPNPKPITLPNNLPNLLNITIVINPLLSLNTLPRQMQSYSIHAPMLQVV